MIRGRVHHGVVLLDDPHALCDGTDVVITPVPRRSRKGPTTKRVTVSRALAKLAGKAKGLPRDAARNLDHHLYGHAKQ